MSDDLVLTINPAAPSVWDQYLTGARVVSSSRPVVWCIKCRRVRAYHPSPHAPRFNAQVQLVDCVGEPV